MVYGGKRQAAELAHSCGGNCCEVSMFAAARRRFFSEGRAAGKSCEWGLRKGHKNELLGIGSYSGVPQADLAGDENSLASTPSMACRGDFNRRVA